MPHSLKRVPILFIWRSKFILLRHCAGQLIRRHSADDSCWLEVLLVRGSLPTSNWLLYKFDKEESEVCAAGPEEIDVAAGEDGETVEEERGVHGRGDWNPGRGVQRRQQPINYFDKLFLRNTTKKHLERKLTRDLFYTSITLLHPRPYPQIRTYFQRRTLVKFLSLVVPLYFQLLVQIFGSKASYCLLKRIPLIFYLLHYVGCKTQFVEQFLFKDYTWDRCYFIHIISNQVYLHWINSK